jgi:hypothetical protein
MICLARSTVVDAALLSAPLSNGGCGVVLDDQLNGPRHFFAVRQCEQRERHVDARRHTGGSDDLAVPDNAFVQAIRWRRVLPGRRWRSSESRRREALR